MVIWSNLLLTIWWYYMHDYIYTVVILTVRIYLLCGDIIKNFVFYLVKIFKLLCLLFDDIIWMIMFICDDIDCENTFSRWLNLFKFMCTICWYYLNYYDYYSVILSKYLVTIWWYLSKLLCLLCGDIDCANMFTMWWYYLNVCLLSGDII